MKDIKELLKDVEVVAYKCSEDLEIGNVTIDSDTVNAESMYIALKGYSEDGNNYIYDSLAKGAKVILSEFPQKNEVPHIVVKNARAAMAIIAGNFYENAHKSLKLIGVVGTNGKTSTVNIISHILKTNGKKVTKIGTLGAYIGDTEYKIDMTTPDPIILNEIFYLSKKANIEYVIMEVSAHAIYLQKVANLHFEYGIFTNLSQDHLDFFDTMDKYRQVKKSFFNYKQLKNAIINSDDTLGLEMILEEKLPITTYGIENPCDVFAIDIQVGNKMSFVVNAMDDIIYINTFLQGKFNIYNLLAAITLCKMLKISERGIVNSIKKLMPISGRFNLINFGKKVIIDYAHTPDGLINLLSSAREICKGRLIAVFGCGGNRDNKKRYIMGEIAGRYADFTIITKDNSRYEVPLDIMHQIEEGVKSETSNYLLIENREMAINYAVAYSKEEDIVLIAGKGAEDYMDENGIKTPYSDREVVQKIAADLKKSLCNKKY